MADSYDDSPLRSLVEGLADADGRIKKEDFSEMICEQMGVSEEQAAEVTQQLDPDGEGYIDVERMYEAFRALIPLFSARNSLNGEEQTDLGGVEDEDDDGPPPALPDSPEPIFDDNDDMPNGRASVHFVTSDIMSPELVKGGYLDNKKLSNGSGPPLSLFRSMDDAHLGKLGREEEFCGEGEDDDAMSGQVTPNGFRSPRRSTATTSSSALHFGSKSWLVQSPSSTSLHATEEEQREVDEQVRQMAAKIETLNEQLTAMTEERDSSENSQRKLKQEYAAMQSRLHHLEEQLREKEDSHEASLRNAQEKNKLKMAHMENKYNSQQSSMKAQISAGQDEIRQLKSLEETLRDQCKEAKKDYTARNDEIESLKKTLNKKNTEHAALVAQQRRETEGASATIDHLQAQLEEVTQRGEQWRKECEELKMKNQKTRTAAEQSSMATQHLEEEVARLGKEISRMNTRNNDLSAQLVKQGKKLMESPDDGKDPESLEAEMNEQTKDELMRSVREERNLAGRLKEYVDNLLLIVMEQSPHLLEVRSK